MKKEEFFEVLGELDDGIVKEAKAPVKENTNGKLKKTGWLKRETLAACLVVVMLVAGVWAGVSFVSYWQDCSVPPIKTIEYNGAVYEIIDMANTKTLNAHNLPHKITADMVGSSLGTGLAYGGNQTEQIMYQYVPYADIVTVTAGTKQERAQRAVYVVEENGGYSFALFCDFIRLDSNAHEEASEMFAVYGIDEAEDIASITIGREKVSDFARIQAIFDNLYYSTSMGSDDYQNTFFKGMSEEDQQALYTELADSAIEMKITTTEGIVIKGLYYHPTINYISWALNYYQLNNPIE